MNRRREFIAAAVAGFAQSAGCVSQSTPADSVSCPEPTRTADDVAASNDPVTQWRLGTPIENPEPRYRPVLMSVVNFYEERDVGILVNRSDTDHPVLDRTVTLGVEEFVKLSLVEPDVWSVELTLSDDISKTYRFETFDCASRYYSIGIRCGGEFTMSGGVALIGPCPDYPVNESGT